jgi:3-deoxy-D-manno-octulosonate 8-phosphate phosphatase (KDO 8-P phosphatase)
MLKIKVLLIDVDGVMTAGTKIYDKTGLCIGKNFCDKDWTAIKRFKAAGVHVKALTGDDWNADILWNRKIDYALTRGKNKEDYVSIICAAHDVKPEEIAYIGDDLFDIGVMNAVGASFAPSDATEDIFHLTEALKLTKHGGKNVLEELFYYMRNNDMIPIIFPEEEYQKILELDAKEKF